jgi:acyl-CoA thioester hydrolase
MVMEQFRFYLPIQVRYGDIDPQRHVNNSRFFTYMEQGRISYFQHLGLWDGTNFDHLGFILLETKITFHAPILYGQSIRVGVRTERLGNKSLEVISVLEDTDSGEEVARGHSILVTYDYQQGQSMLIPKAWRKVVEEYEGMGGFTKD